MEIKQRDYIDAKSISDTFNKDIRNFSFADDCENGSFYFLYCNDTWIEDTLECIKDMEGTRYEEKYQNTLALQKYLHEVMGISDGIYIYVHW